MENVRVCFPAFQGFGFCGLDSGEKETIYGNKDSILDEARKGFKCIACLEKASSAEALKTYIIPPPCYMDGSFFNKKHLSYNRFSF